jgi:hypothetical protein
VRTAGSDQLELWKKLEGAPRVVQRHAGGTVAVSVKDEQTAMALGCKVEKLYRISARPPRAMPFGRQVCSFRRDQQLAD